MFFGRIEPISFEYYDCSLIDGIAIKNDERNNDENKQNIAYLCTKGRKQVRSLTNYLESTYLFPF